MFKVLRSTVQAMRAAGAKMPSVGLGKHTRWQKVTALRTSEQVPAQGYQRMLATQALGVCVL